MPDLKTPVLPYAGTSGHSGSETSRARAERRDSSGQTLSLQQKILAVAELRQSWGVTVAEVRVMFSDHHHGSLSGALSLLHKAGRLYRLADVTRKGCAVYVTGDYVNKRATVAHGRKVRTEDMEVVEYIADTCVGHTPDALVEVAVGDLQTLVRLSGHKA